MPVNKYKNIGLWLIRIGLFVTPFIPLYVSKVLFFPYITGKAFAFRIIVEVVFAAWIFLAIFYKEYRPRKSYLAWAVGIFILVTALATAFGANPFKSFWSGYERMEGLVTYLHLGAYFLVLGSVFQKKDWLIFFNLFVAAGLVENIHAIFQRLGYLVSLQGGIGRPDGTIGNPTYLAAYLLFVFGIALFLWLHASKKWLKFYYLGAALFTAFIIFMTASRGPALALIAGVVLGSIFYLIFSRKKETTFLNKKILLGILLLFLVVPSVVWLGRESDLVKNNFALSRLTLLSLTERTVSSRFIMWDVAREGFKERFLLGWGPDNFGLVFAKHFKAELWQQEPWFDRAHSIVFDWLVNAGILGLLAYLGILIAALFLFWKSYREKKISLEELTLFFALFLAYLIHNLVVFDQIATYLGFFAILAYAHSVNTSRELKEEKTSISVNKMFMLMIAIILPTAVVFYFVNWKPLQANLTLLNALVVQGQNIPAGFSAYQKALAYNTFGNVEIREQFVRFAIDAGGSPKVDADLKDQILRSAITESQKSVLENPADPRSYLFLGTIYSRVGLLDDAIKIFNQAAELSPKKQQIYFEIADVYIKKGDYASAIQILEKTLDYDRSYRQARMNLVLVYILNNQQAEADRLLIEEFGTVDAPDVLLVQIYSKVKNYPRLISVWKALVRYSPETIDYRVNLAGAYMLAGQPQQAILIIEEAIQMNPAFTQDGLKLIQQIKAGK
ncbi:MAG: O-antigen ligase family protein [bacterium]|nr:O-antigen ligase family protein [bacterium]